MIWFVFISGIILIGLCLVIIIKPKIIHEILDYISLGSRLYLGGIIRIILGITLLFLANRVQLWGYVITIGIIITAAGLWIFFLPLKRTKELLLRLKKQPDLFLRIYAVIALVIWGLLLYTLLPVLTNSIPH